MWGRRFHQKPRVIKDLTTTLHQKHHIVFCDNFFTSIKLFQNYTRMVSMRVVPFMRTGKVFWQTERNTPKEDLEKEERVKLGTVQ